ncbi:MAG: hypothetical protein ABNH64_13235, partial [Hyphomonas sp.]
AAGAIGIMIGGVALDLIHFPEKAEYGSVPAETIWQLGLVYAPLASLMILITLYFFSQYRITRVLHEKIVDTIRSRRRAAQASE